MEKKSKRYPGTRSFQDNDADRFLFKGRSEEVQQLFHLILSEKLVVLFAKSGVGKSSLLNAGIFKLLRDKNYFPVTVRLNSPELSLLDSIDLYIKEEVKKTGIEYSPGNKSSIWEFFKSTELWSKDDLLMTPVLVFDQFEEIFTLDYTDEQRKNIFGQIADLIHGNIPESISSVKDKLKYTDNTPKIKVVLSLREDFLALLEEMAVEIPSILKNRYRLKALTEDQAREAIIEPAEIKSDKLLTRQFTYDDEAIDTILAFLNRKVNDIGKTISFASRIWPWKYILMLIAWLLVSTAMGLEINQDPITGAIIFINLFIILLITGLLAYKYPIRWINAFITTFLTISLFFTLGLTFYIFLFQMRTILISAFVSSEFLIMLLVLAFISMIPAFISWRRLKRKVEPTSLRNTGPSEIEPFQLQLLCQHIENRIQEKQISGLLSEEDVVVNVNDFGGEEGIEQILRTFYSNITLRIPAKYRRTVRKLCERALISPKGRRLSLSEDIIADKYKIQAKVLDQLIDNRLLRKEPKLGTYYYEISHDTLIHPIAESGGKRRRHGYIGLSAVGAVLFLFLITLIVEEYIKSKKTSDILSQFSIIYYEINTVMTKNDVFLNNDVMIISDKIDSLKVNTDSLRTMQAKLDSLNKLYIDLTGKSPQYSVISLATDISYYERAIDSLQRTKNENENLIVKTALDKLYSEIGQIEKNISQLIKSNDIPISEKAVKLNENILLLEQKKEYLKTIVRRYPRYNQYDFDQIIINVEDDLLKYRSVSDDLSEKLRMYRGLTQSENFVLCKEIDYKRMKPLDISTQFPPGNVYVWLQLAGSENYENLYLIWLDEKGIRVDKNSLTVRPGQNVQTGYHYYSSPGLKEVRLYNSDNLLINGQKFRIYPVSMKK